MAVRAATFALLGALFGGATAAAAELATPPSNSFPVATEVRVGGDDAQTRFVMDVTRKIDLRAFTLPIHIGSSSTFRK